MASQAALGRLFERGVWWAPYLVRGLPALIAVDALGVARKHVVLEPGADVVRHADALLDALDRIDPAGSPMSEPTPRHLELVKAKPLAAPPAGVIPLTPMPPLERFLAFDPYGT